MCFEGLLKFENALLRRKHSWASIPRLDPADDPWTAQTLYLILCDFLFIIFVMCYIVVHAHNF